MQRGLRLREFDSKPSWVLDEQAWEYATKLASKHAGQSEYGAIVTHLYKGMGGRVGSGPVMIAKPEKTADEKALDIIVQNPNISGPTLLNTMKAKGLAVVDKTDEADSSSSFPAALRAPKESFTTKFMGARLIESSASDDGIGPTMFRTILIQEGLGNFGTCFYYTKEALRSAVPIFEGKKIYADHPSTEESLTRPERSVRDVLGYFSEVRVVEGEDGRLVLKARVNMMDEQNYAWARGLMRYAVKYSKEFPDKDFVGLSINATGDAHATELEEFMKDSSIPSSAKPKLVQAREMGVSTIRIVTELTEATSCDLVTEAGAGGRILEMIEQEKTLMAKKKKASETKVEETKETKTEVVTEAADTEKPHDDAAQDVELIKSMLKKYVGKKDEEMDESDMSMGKEMYYAAKEMGLEGDECMQAAGYAMKMNRHMAAKKAEACQKEAEAAAQTTNAEVTTPAVEPVAVVQPTESATPQTEEKKDDAVEVKEAVAQVTEAEKDDDADEAGKASDKETTVVEANGADPRDKQILELTARLGVAEGKIKAKELTEYLDRKCKESRLPNSLTSKFKETLGSPKSEKHIDDTLKVFMDAAQAAFAESGSPGFVPTLEKQNGGGARNVSFADCLRDE